MTKYRIREEEYRDHTQYILQEKGLFFWKDCRRYDLNWKVFVRARFSTLKEAKDYVQRKQYFEKRLAERDSVKIKYHEV